MADFTVRDMQTGELHDVSKEAFEARDPNVWVLVTRDKKTTAESGSKTAAKKSD
jgi:hypothetical protein